jgi:osmotically-inducible protein OsmY
LVKCDYHEGVLTLRGWVPTYHQKQVAQTLVQSLAGVLEVKNRLEVMPASGSPRKPR